MKIRNLHSWNLSYTEAAKLQKKLKEKLVLNSNLPKKIKIIGGVDVSFQKMKMIFSLLL